MTLIEHIKELRRRLFIALLAIMIVTIVIAVWAYHPIFNFLRHPYCELPPARRAGGKSCDLIFTHPTDAFFVRLRVSLISGVLFSAPIWLYELWAFITPGLHRNERRWTLAFLTSATLLFAAGATMAYLFLRTALDFLLGFGGNGIKSLLTVTDYLSFVTHLLIVFGASFLFPLVIILLNLAGILSAKRLAKHRRIEIFLVLRVRRLRDPFRRPVHDARARHRALPVLRGRDPVREVERSPPRPPRRAGGVRRPRGHRGLARAGGGADRDAAPGRAATGLGQRRVGRGRHHLSNSRCGRAGT